MNANPNTVDVERDAKQFKRCGHTDRANVMVEAGSNFCNICKSLIRLIRAFDLDMLWILLYCSYFLWNEHICLVFFFLTLWGPNFVFRLIVLVLSG